MHAASSSFWRAIVAATAVTALGAAPAVAAHRARVSADLEDHLAAGSQTIDVIVHGTRAEVDALTGRYNLRVKRHLKSGAVLQVTAGQLAALQSDEQVDHLSGDVRIRASEVTAETIGADQVWAGNGDLPPLTGAGVGVAVIDSGIDFKHRALENRVLVTVDFTGGDGQDRYGHGTHVAAIIAGQAGRTVETQDYRGIASGAYVVNLRVLGNDGSGYASDVIEAIDWAIDHRKAYNIRVINLSLGAPVLQSYRDDPVCEAVERAVAAGIIVVAAAGNHGQTADGRRVYGGITSPGNDPSVITVGALDTHGTAIRSDDTVAKYSSRGPTLYDLVLKPDLVAPGSHVVSAEAQGSYLAGTYPHRHIAGSGDDAYIQLSGTSMAAGVVSGSVALILEEKSKSSPREAKAVLQLTSSFMPDEGLLASGAGSVNVLAAVSFVNTNVESTTTEIAGESVAAGGLAYIDASEQTSRSVASVGVRRFARDLKHAQTVVWGGTIVWGGTVVWGGTIATNETIVWGGTVTGDTIVWGGGASDTIVWGGSTEGDTIVWGGSDTIVWGGSTDSDTIVWGGNTD